MTNLLIGDIHGRTFWKEAVEKYKDKVDKIIFLGDYLDPYPWECALDGITRKSSIRNLQEIIDLKAENKEKVILLLGNHDLPYIHKRLFFTRIRYDSSNAWHIEKMFSSHRSLFQLAYEETNNNKSYLFTHAGLVKGWYDDNKETIGELTADSLNHLQDTPDGIKALCQITKSRGGYDRYGSIVWNDADDIIAPMNDGLPWDYQIFGHTQQEKHPIITDEYACIDCRRALILNDEGGFEEC